MEPMTTHGDAERMQPSAPASKDDKRRRRIGRPRISLLGFFALVTIVCLVVALWSTLRERQALWREVQQHRKELGYLTIEDPSCVHAVRLETIVSLTWKWRLYVPKEGTWYLRHRFGDMPRDATGDSGTLLKPGEYVLTCTLREDVQGIYRLYLQMPGYRLKASVTDHFQNCVRSSSTRLFSESGVGQEQVVKEAGKPLTLFRIAVAPEIDEHSATEQSVVGFTLWIE